MLTQLKKILAIRRFKEHFKYLNILNFDIYKYFNLNGLFFETG